ncbi:MAG: hypothetical protein ACETV1_05025 [Candidatus Bathyarchaeia archaeon]
MTENKYLERLSAWCPKESLKKSVISQWANIPTMRRDLRKEILQYTKIEEMASSFKMQAELNICPDTLVRELSVLAEKGCLNVYSGGLYSLTPEGRRELRMLRGEYDRSIH